MAGDERNTGEGWRNEGNDDAQKNDRDDASRESTSRMNAGSRSEDSADGRGIQANADDLDGSIRARRDEGYGEVY